MLLGFEQGSSCTLQNSLDCWATSVDTFVHLTMYMLAVIWHVTCWLVSEVRHGPRRTARSGHVAGQGLYMDLQEAELRRVARS
jgi:hypothetical protein